MIMAEKKDVVLLMEQPQEEADEDYFGKSTDGSDHAATLAGLKSELSAIEEKQTSNLQCPKVPEKLLLQDIKDAKGYNAPKCISLGPYHHQTGKDVKLKLAKIYFHQFWMTDEDKVYPKISRRVRDWKACYDKETVGKFKDDCFTKMMVVDGCALLGYICCVCLGLDLQKYGLKYEDLSRVHQDALLLENQLPYQLLEVLMNMEDLGSDHWTVIFQEFFGMIEESFFQEFFGIKKKSFLHETKNYCRQLFDPVIRSLKGNPEPKHEEESKPCHHLLDLYLRNFLGKEPSDPKRTAKRSDKKEMSVKDVKDHVMASFRNVKELMAAGIRIKPSPTRYLKDISFTSYCITACLRLPPITIDKSTKTLFLNLIAHEMSTDGPHDFISYLRFLDSLIDHADDVKELQAAGVLQNNLGTHEEVAEFFNTVSTNLESNFHAYRDVRVKIRKHLKSHNDSKLKMWMTQCLDTYFGSPWTIIAWIGAALALFLTAVQTYFSAFSR